MAIVDPFKPQSNSAGTGIVDPFKAPAPPILQRPARAAPEGFVDSAIAGFKRSLPETKALLGGAVGLAGDLVGADGIRDYGLGVYKDTMENDVAPLQTAEFTDVLDGKASLGEFAGGAIGNFGGQLLQSGAAAAAGAIGGAAVGSPTGPGAAVSGVVGAIGGLVGRQGAKKVIGDLTENLIADQVKKGVAREAAEAGARSTLQRIGLGAAAAPLALNVGQESGGTYSTAVDVAEQEGRELTQGDALRAGAAGVAGGLIDTVADATGLGALGGRFAGSLGSRVVKGALAQGAVEGATETVQQGLQRFGAQQDLTGEEANREYLNSFAAGAVGGGAIGGAGGLQTPVEQDDIAPAAPTDAAPSAAPPVAPPTPTTEVALRIRADTAPTPEARQQARAELADMLEQQGRMLPSPNDQVVTVGPDGTARTPAQTLGIAQNRARELQSQADMGLTPDVLAAQKRDPRVPVPRFPNATPGSLADAANAITSAAPAAPPQQAATSSAAPVVPAGIDSTTGEALPEQGEEAARRSILMLLEQGRAPDPRMIAGATGITPRRASEIRAEIAQQRKAEAKAADEQRRATAQAKAEPEPAAAPTSEQPSPSPSTAMGETPSQDESVVTATAPMDLAAPMAEESSAVPARGALEGELVEPNTIPQVARPPLSARMGNQEFAVESFEDASSKFLELKERGDIGGMEAVRLVDQNGTEVGFIGQSGEVYDQPLASVGSGNSPAPVYRPPAQEAELAERKQRAAEDGAEPAALPAAAISESEPVAVESALANAYRKAADAVEASEPVEKALANLDDAQVRAVAKAMKMTFSPKAGRNKIIEKISDSPSGDFRERGLPILRQLAQQDEPTPATATAVPDQEAAAKPKQSRRTIRGRVETLQPNEAGAAVDATAEVLRRQEPDPTAAERFAKIDEGFAQNRERLAKKKFKKGETVSYIQSGEVKTGVIESIEKDQGMAMVGNSVVAVRRLFRPGEEAPTPAQAATAPAADEPAAPKSAVEATSADAEPAEAVQEESSTVAAAAAEAATSPENDLPAPTEAQKEAGNYKKGHIVLNGLDITIENPAGSKRRDEWPALAHHYGYIKRTEGADGDHVDVFLSDDAGNPELPVFVVDQRNRDGGFDEHKVMLGFADEAAARAGYLANYTKGWSGLGAITQMSLDDFKTWLREGDTTKPVVDEVPAAESLAAAAPVPTPAPAASGELRPKVRINNGKPEYVEGHPDTLAAYFTPGRIVKAYGGLDRVLEFRAAAENTPWAVRVVRVDDNGEPVKGERERWHGTQPETRELVKVFGKPVAPQKGKAAKQAGDAPLFSQPERRARSDGRGQRSIDFAGATFVERSGTYLLADDAGQPRDFFRVADAEAEATRLGAEVLQDAPTDGRRTWSVRLPAREQAVAERELLDEPAEALFSQTTPAAGVDAVALKAEVDGITAKWEGDAPPVTVAATPDDPKLPDGVRDDPGAATAEGVYYRGRVYLIASNIKSMQRAKQVLAHEAFGHYGVEAVLGAKEWAHITRDVGAMRKNREGLSDAMREVLNQADLRYAKETPERYAKEIIAIMAERGVQASMLNRVFAAVRRFLRRFGLLDSFNEADVRDVVTRGMRRVEGRGRAAASLQEVMKEGAPVFASPMGAPAVASRVMRMAARHDDLFKFPKSAATTLRGVFDDLKLDFVVAPTADLRISFEQDGSDARRPPNTSVFVIRQRGSDKTARLFVEQGGKNRMYLDISEFESGAGMGAGVYSALFNYAHNAGKVFIGDPAGLSDEALLRRTEHMLSAALKFGTTRMMEPHPRQVNPRGQFGGYKPQAWAHPVEWLTGNDAHNIAALLEASYHNHRQFISEVPGVEQAIRDLPLGPYSGLRGGALSDRELERIAAEAGERFRAHPDPSFGRGRAPAIGRASVARYVLTERLVRTAESDQRLGFLASVATELSSGRLSPELNGLFYSQPGPDAAQLGESLFSQPAPADLEKAVEASVVDSPMTDRIRQAFEDATTGGNLKDAARRGLLYTITLRHIAELGGKLLPSLKDYVATVQQMATDRTIMQEDVSKTADTWDRLQRRDRRGADSMANLAHDATIEGVDPDVEYQPLTFATFQTVKEGGKTTQRRVELPVTRRNIEDAVNALKLRRRTADDATKKELNGQISQLEERLAQEQKRSAAYPGLLTRWQAMPEAWRQVYREARDAYTAQSKRYEEALVAKIEALVADGKTRASYVASIRQQFEAQRVEGPYFPLARFGNLYVAAVSPSGEQVFSMYETVAEWKRAQADLRRRGYTKIRASEKISEVRNGGGPSSAFMADLMDTLGKAGVDNDAKDAVYQLYLRSMPDLSIRKSFIHRKKTAGYSDDALRAFASNLFHGSFQIARLRHSHHLDAAIDGMKNREEALRESDPEKAQQAAVIITEMEKRHEWVMNPQDSAVANALTSIGFVWYLGVSPAAALVNLSQVPIVSLPVLGAKFGFGKASAALLDGMKRAIRNANGDLTRGLGEEERRAFKVWYESGAIEKTMTHSLAGLSDSDTTQFSPVYRRTMEIVSSLFHKAEVVNREATALAAFRLARESGQTFDEATRYANDVIWESQFDYSSANRARVMQGNVQKVLFMFRQYSLNMTWFLWRNAIQALKGESPEVKRDAQRKLAGVMGMTTLFAGTLGLPMTSVMFGVANAAAAAFGDDEEPWDAEIAFRNFLADYLGPDAARLITGGAIEAATGVEISSRTSLNDLWYRSPDRELEGEGAWAHVLETIAGPVGGIFKGVLVSGPSLIEQGHVWRGVEAMVPKFVRDVLRSIRYTDEGVNTISGMPVISELSLAEELAQLSGFGPSRLADRYDANNAARNYADRLARRRQRLLNALAMSIQAGDQSEVQDTMARIRKWNEEVPQLAIDRKTIDRSLAQRARYAGRAVSGVVLDRRIEQQALEQGRFAEAE